MNAIMPYDRFLVLLRKNAGDKEDGYTYIEIARALSIEEQTLKNAKSQGALVSFGQCGRNPLFAPDAIYAYYKLITKRNLRMAA